MQQPTQTSQTLLERWENQKILRENQTYKRKPKKANKHIRKNKKEMFKSFRPTLGYGFCFFVVFYFPESFLQNKQIPRENQNYQRKPKKTKQTLGKTKTTKCLRVSASPLDMFFVCVFVGFPYGFYKTNKSIEKTTNTKEYQRKPKTH